MNNFSATQDIGFRATRFDALDKAMGREEFATDFYPDNMLWVGALRAGVPHGLLRSVNIADALAMEGVVTVLTRNDISGANRQGFVYWDMPVLCGSKIRHSGDAIALVVAEDRDTLQRGLNAISMDIEPLPVVDSIDAALADNAPQVHELQNGNILKEAVISKGDAEDALADCDVVLEETFFTPVQEHAFLETENGVAQLDDDGIIHMTVSTQSPFRDRIEIARALGIDPAKLHIKSPYLGGGFGGKDGATVHCLLALAAMHTDGRPVKMWWNREESLLAGYKRHAARLQYRLGARKDGTLVALQCLLDFDTGAYAHLGVEVMALGLEHAAGPYRIDNLEARGRCIYTNNPIAGAFRGFGVAQVSFAFEGMMDRLARTLCMDGLELRQKNVLNRGDRNAVGVTMTQSTGIAECLQRLSQHQQWQNRARWMAEAPAFTRRGVGLSCVFNGMGYGCGLPDCAIAKIKLTPDGHFRIYNAVSDMGQGNASTFVQIAAEILCQRKDNFELIQPDTAQSHPSGSSSAGRTTYTYGNALIKASQAMQKKLFQRAALLLLADSLSDFTMVPGAVRHMPTGKDIPLAQIANIMHPEDRLCIADHLMVITPEKPVGAEAFQLGFPHLIYPYAAHLAFIEVDELTGVVQVVDYQAWTDAGRVLNPLNYEQQVQGAIAQGIGYALSEEVKTSQGVLQTRDLSTYIIPSSLDLPDITSHAVETIEHTGPFGMKGVGEVGINGPLPALGSAMIAAGIFMNQAPFTPERVLAALSSQEVEPC